MADRAARRAANKRWQAKMSDIQREKRRMSKRAWYKANKDKTKRYSRAYSLKRDYGMTLVDYSKLVAMQDGKCAICRVDEQYGGQNWAVDHDHATGKVRGALCHRCNVGIGMFGDNIGVMLTAVKYLEAARG